LRWGPGLELQRREDGVGFAIPRRPLQDGGRVLLRHEGHSQEVESSRDYHLIDLGAFTPNACIEASRKKPRVGVGFLDSLEWLVGMVYKGQRKGMLCCFPLFHESKKIVVFTPCF
jgi:hypothetical protein